MERAHRIFLRRIKAFDCTARGVAVYSRSSCPPTRRKNGLSRYDRCSSGANSGIDKERGMADEKLKRILEDAANAAKDARNRATGEQQQRQASMSAAGQALSQRVIPRLLAASREWNRGAILEVEDLTTTFELRVPNRVFPSIVVKFKPIGNEGGQRIYRIETFSNGDINIFKIDPATRDDKESISGKFGVKNLNDFTDDKIDEFLTLVVRDAFGLT
jgi:hypothetical protein